MPHIETDNKFAPPKAAVADVGQLMPLPMPTVVRAATSCLYAEIILAAAAYALMIFSTHQTRSEQIGLGAAIAVLALILLLIIYFIGKRSRIARIVLTVLVLYAIFGKIFGLAPHLNHQMPRPVAWAGFSMRVIAGCLLYAKPANAWFKRRDLRN